MERTLSARDAERASVLARVRAQTLALREAAKVLGMCNRQARRLLARYQLAEPGAWCIAPGDGPPIAARRFAEIHADRYRRVVFRDLRGLRIPGVRPLVSSAEQSAVALAPASIVGLASAAGSTT